MVSHTANRSGLRRAVRSVRNQIRACKCMSPKRNPSGLHPHADRLSLLSGLWLLVFAVFQVVAAPSGLVEKLSRNDLKPLNDGMPGEEGLETKVVLADGVKMSATVEVTAKGNGWLRIGNLKLKVFDSHDDGSYYEGEMLKVEFADLDGDGRREMVISGLVCFTDQKVDRVLRREAVAFIYALQPDRTFKQVYRNTDVRIDP